jgi:hypothetical protein
MYELTACFSGACNRLGPHGLGIKHSDRGREPVRRWHGKAEIETRSATSRDLAFLRMPSKLSSPLLTKEPRPVVAELFRVSNTIASSSFPSIRDFLVQTNDFRLVRQILEQQGRKGRQSCVSLSARCPSGNPGSGLERRDGKRSKRRRTERTTTRSP